MKRTDKKGFTIVELVIVIAVIAILAAVLIPNISKLVQKANTSADESLVRNLNTALSMDVEKHTTMSAALKAAKDNGGYDLETIELKGKGNKILWDSVNDCFVYLKGTDRVYLPNTQSVKKADKMEKYEYFEILEKMPTAEEMKKQEYSIYLAGKADIGEVKVSVGFDVGANKASKVTLNTSTTTKENSSFLIYTNGGELVVKADNAAVEHYGEATIVTIEAVAMNSYHENGTVNEIKLAQGRVVVEAKAEVGSVLVTATNNTNAKVEVKASAKLGAIGADNNQVELSKIVSGAENTEIVETVITNTDFAGGFGTEKAPYLIATAEQFLNVSNLNDTMKSGHAMYFKLISDLDLSTVRVNGSYICSYFSGSFDGANHTLITNDSLDGIFGAAVNNVVFKNLKYKLFTNPVKLCRGVSVDTGANITVEYVDISTVNKEDNVRLSQNTGLYFNNVGYDPLTENWCDNYRTTLLIANCFADANISAESYNAVFVGSMLNNADVTVKNCTYGGQYYGEYVNLVYGNTCSDTSWINYVKSTMTIENVLNNGAMYGTKRAALIAGGATNVEASAHTVIKNCSLGTTRALTDATLGIVLDANKQAVIEKATADTAYYLLTFVGGGRRTGEYTINSSYRFNIKIESAVFDDNNKFATGYKVGKMITAEQYKTIDSSASFVKGTGNKAEGEENAEFWVKEFDGTTYYVFMFENSYYHFETSKDVSGATDINQVLVTAYDKDGKPIAQVSSK